MRLRRATAHRALGAGCLGNIVLQTVPRGGGGGGRAVSRAREPVEIGSGLFQLDQGESAEVEIPLTSAGQRLLRKKKKLRAEVTLESIAPSGAMSQSTSTVRIRRVRTRPAP